jgi:uncharacterized RDD family membrane protein YckC
MPSPSTPEARFAAGLEFLNRRQFREAAEAFIETIQNNYYAGNSYYYLSQAYMGLGHLREATEAYNRAIYLGSTLAAPPKTGGLEFAGFWPRFLASVVDSIISYAILIPLMIWIYGVKYFEPGQQSQEPIYNLLFSIFVAVVFICCWVGWSATPGKMILSMRIVDAETGGKPSFAQFVGRFLGYYLSALPLFLGYLWAVFDRRKQTWHDKLAGTVVVRKGSQTKNFSQAQPYPSMQPAYQPGYAAYQPFSNQPVFSTQPVERKSQANPVLAGILGLIAIVFIGGISTMFQSKIQKMLIAQEEIRKATKDSGYNPQTTDPSNTDLSKKGDSRSPTNSVLDPKPVVEQQIVIPAKTPPSLPYRTYLAFESDKGDYIGSGEHRTFTPDTGRFVSDVNSDRSRVIIRIESTREWWTLEIAAPQGSRLLPGVYVDAERSASQSSGKPGLSLSGNSRTCGRSQGKFVIDNINYGKNGELALLDATFAQYCDGSPSALLGRVHYESSKIDPVEASTAPRSSKPPIETSPAGIPPRLERRFYLSLSSNKANINNGYRRTYTSDDGSFASQIYYQGGFNINFNGPRESWSFTVNPPAGSRLSSGIYNGIDRYPRGSMAGMDFNLNNMNCRNPKWRLVIEDMIVGKKEVELLDATFELYCDKEAGTVYGRIFYDKRKDLDIRKGTPRLE